jgi:hypothetical protein
VFARAQRRVVRGLGERAAVVADEEDERVVATIRPMASSMRLPIARSVLRFALPVLNFAISSAGAWSGAWTALNAR